MKYLLFPLVWLLACSSPKTEYKIVIKPQESGSEASLRGLDVVNEQVAWASGSQGTVLKTTDGGTTWQNVSILPADTVDFRDIEAFSASEAVVLSAGYPGISYRTSDGGKTWQLVYLDERPEIFFDAMDFWDNNSGMAFGDAIDEHLVLIKTDDGGHSWQLVPQELSPEALNGEGGFAASGTCITTFGDSSVWVGLGAPRSRVLYSANRGKTWQAVETPMAQGKPGAGIFSLAFATANYGMAIGGNYMAPDDTTKVIANTHDGGKSWQLVLGSGINGYKSAITNVPESQLWLAAGPTGVSFSKDNGLSWILSDTTGYHTLVMASSTKGWLTGGKGKIARLQISQ